MAAHLYCCQNTLQNLYDHIVPVLDDFNVNHSCLFGTNKDDFIIGLKELTEIIKSIYADMINNPAEYGLPLVEDIEYKPFNPKAAISKKSSFRLVALLYTLARNSELKGNDLKVNENNFSKELKNLKSMFKVTNSKMIFNKLRNYGFIYEDNTFSYSDNHSVIPALYGYMKNVPLQKPAIFSLNYNFAATDLPSHSTVFTEYLSENEREFFILLNEFMLSECFNIGNTGDYNIFSYSIEYLMDSKDDKRIVRCYSDFGKLGVWLKLHNSDCYDYYIEKLPEKIKQIFRKESSCKFCIESCGARIFRTFEGTEYTDCGYGNYFIITSFDLDDIKYYKQIILLERKAEKINARKKEIKVYLD